MSKYALQQTVAPTDEPINLAEAKDYGWVTGSDDDAVILKEVKAVRNQLERLTGIQLVTATWKMYLDCFPQEIIIPKTPLISVSSIAYVDTAGDSQTLASTVYQVDAISKPGRIMVAYAQTWPAIQASTYNAVTITFTAGYGTAADVPYEIKHILWQATKYRFDHRDETDELWLDQFLTRHWPGYIF